MTPKWTVISFRLGDVLARMPLVVFCCGFVTVGRAQTNYQRLRSFGCPELSGCKPHSSLTEGRDGKLYGTTKYGGSDDAGTVFKLNEDGSNYEVLYPFRATGGDGRNPQARLVEGSDGALYGTTAYGGNEWGTVFKLNKDGSGYRVLHSFGVEWPESVLPELTEGTDHALYGTTTYGGGINGFGTVFKLDHDGSNYRVIHSFTGTWEDGGNPSGGVTEGSDGRLYGTALSCGTNGCGTVFRLNKDGSGYTVLISFSGFDGNGYAGAGVVQGSDGALYGTASGGTNGVEVFKLNVDGSGYQVLQSFQSVWAGAYAGRWLVTRDRLLYGFTTVGHADVIFRLNTDGSAYELLHTFTGAGDGQYPNPGLVQGADGALYGTTEAGGSIGAGTVFRLFASIPIVAITRIESTGAGAELSLSGGAAGQTFEIQGTLNLATPFWQTIGTNQFGIDGKSEFLDTSASNYPTRFYRSVTP